VKEEATSKKVGSLCTLRNSAACSGGKRVVVKEKGKRGEHTGECTRRTSLYSHWLRKQEELNKFHEFLQPVGLKAWSFRSQWAWLG